MEWIKEDTFNTWMKEREKEKSKSWDEQWSPKERGTDSNPKVYVGRFLPDPNGVMYKKFFYHMYKNEAGEYIYILCPKTYDFKNFCPLCFTSGKLYSGSERDKQLAKNYKRNIRFLGNWYLIEDPRDVDVDEPAWTGKVWPWEFPPKIETKLDEELKDNDGLGIRIFDPGVNGYNFNVKVKETGDKDQKFPNYDSSSFSRKATALGTDKEIKKIMESCVSVVDVIAKKYSENNWPKVQESLIEASLWTDALQREWTKHFGAVEQANDNPVDEPEDNESPSSNKVQTEESKEQPVDKKLQEEDFIKSLEAF
jgi:hypothetical protein